MRRIGRQSQIHWLCKPEEDWWTDRAYNSIWWTSWRFLKCYHWRGFSSWIYRKAVQWKGDECICQLWGVYIRWIRRLYEKGHRRIAFLPLKSRSNTNLKLKSKAETKFTGLRLILQIPYIILMLISERHFKVHDRRSTRDSNDLRRFGIIGKSAEYTVFHGKTAWRRYFRESV